MNLTKTGNCRLKTANFFSLLITFYILNSTFCIAEIRYVSHTGTSTPPYTSWETAADSIQKAIDICVDGDTVIVANGVYYEAIYVDKTINLWGSSMDSTIIDGTNISGFDIVYFFENNSTFKYFTITSSNPQRNGIVTRRANLVAEFCKIFGLESPLNIRPSSVNISNFIIHAFLYGITDECATDNCNSVYTNNIIISTNASETPVRFTFGGNPTFTNNIVLGSGNLRGVDIQSNRGAKVKNNIVSGTSSINIRAGQITTDTAYFENNISLNSAVAFSSSTGHRTKVKNNIAKDVFRGVNSGNGTIIPDYNLFWNVGELVFGTSFLGDSNIVADPMFINDTIPNLQLDFDHHLQAYSPAIDAGDPNILDVDGSRSDIGMFGGPLGERYTYHDLAPKPPADLTAAYKDNAIHLNWKRNTEADLSHYRIYRDTVPNFIYDKSKMIGETTDTSFIDILPDPNQSKNYYYKITAFDNQGNQSAASEEVKVIVTGLGEIPPIVVEEYKLLNNFQIHLILQR